ncbi:hypothetical protein ACS0TY_017492 [Phlomoides rotata]
MATLNSCFSPASQLVRRKNRFSLSNSSSYHLSTLSKPFLNLNLAAKSRPFCPPINTVTENKEVAPTEENGDQDEEKGPVSRITNNVFDINSPDRLLNAAIVLGAGSLAITKLLTIDHDYWHCYEGKPMFEFDRTRMFRSGLVGFTLHGSLSHYYYQFCEALFPSKDWWVVPAKVAFDQTFWSAVWNSIYFVVLGLLRVESPASILNELKTTFWPMLTAGWKLWPFAHVITYGVIPVEQRLLWVDCIELIWVTILSTYSNDKSEERISEASEVDTGSQLNEPPKE